jgi:surfactin synthase thioesterase subunit
MNDFALNSLANPWLPRRGLRADSALRLFCLPHAGGGSAAFHRWSVEFSGDIDVVPLLPPGRERRIAEVAFSNLFNLVGALADALQPHLTQPYALFGHSMGALTAFELCRELRRRELPAPRRLFVAAFRAPQLPPKSYALHALPDGELVAALQERFQGIPPEIAQNEDLLSLFLPPLRADLTAIETYQYVPEAPLDCLITALGGVNDAQVSVADLAAWRLQTNAEFSQKMLPGGHFFVTQDSANVARIVRGQLARDLGS